MNAPSGFFKLERIVGTCDMAIDYRIHIQSIQAGNPILSVDLP